MQFRIAIAALCATLMTSAVATHAGAASVVQIRTFDFQQLLSTTLSSYSVSATKSQSLQFDAFNTNLGTLTGASWSLASVRLYDTAISMSGSGFHVLNSNQLSTTVRFDGGVLGSGGLWGPRARSTA